MFYSERLAHAPSSSAVARRVVERLDGRVDRETLDNLRLLVSELVSNAVEHVAAEDDIGLEVRLAEDRVRVEVTDGGPGFVHRPRQAGDPKGSGWGLHFVSQLADAWGSDAETGSRVWFELPVQVHARRA
jgi:anti-sigma regulatory factor (Ser/Thr protein kinase)